MSPPKKFKQGELYFLKSDLSVFLYGLKTTGLKFYKKGDCFLCIGKSKDGFIFLTPDTKYTSVPGEFLTNNVYLTNDYKSI